MSELNFASATEIAQGISKQTYSAREVTSYFLQRIKDLNSRTNSFVTITEEYALKRAQELDNAQARGEKLGILHGVPVAIKDLGDALAGIRSTFGSIPMRNFVPNQTTSYIQKLVDAGAVIVGKTNSPEFGHKGITDNYVSGATSTPFDLSRNSGGSSGGSAAAVADGLVPIAQGSDGGGSVRIPSAWCGTYAIKPSFGRIAEVARPNAFALSSPFVSIGPISRTVADSALMLSAMAGSHPRDPYSLPDPERDLSVINTMDNKKIRIAFSPDMGGFPVDTEVEKVTRKAVETLQAAGMEVQEVSLKLPATPMELSKLWVRLMGLLYVDAFAGFSESGYNLLSEHKSSLSPYLVESLEKIQLQSAIQSREDQRLRTQIYDMIANVFDTFDFLISPTLAINPVLNVPNGKTSVPTHVNGIEIEPSIGWCLTFLINFTGNPAASVPSGFTKDGLPVGLQIVGKRHDDWGVLSLSKIWEQIQPWINSYPLNRK